MDTLDVVIENVYCDKVRLNQVLLNLLSNAVKFTPPGGTVSVRIAQLDSSSEETGLYEFRVKDTGIGMSREFAERIFIPFERERSSAVGKIQGTGLGMPIAKPMFMSDLRETPRYSVSKILPSVEITTTLHGINFPLA